ncbi:MAG: hypothetical protein WBE21_06995 [Candidatus Acidiferrales bacterium]
MPTIHEVRIGIGGSELEAFQDDPEWKSVKAKSEQNGKLAEKIDSTFLTLTDFSPRVG